MARTLSQEELAGEAGVSVDRIGWLVGIGVLKPPRLASSVPPTGIPDPVPLFRVEVAPDGDTSRPDR